MPAAASPPAFRVPHLKRILVATDLTLPGHDPLRYALSLAPAGGEIRLIHVIPAPEAGFNPLVKSVTYLGNSMVADKARAAAQAALDTITANVPHSRTVRLSSEAIIHEDTAEAICAAAEHFGADIICMGSSGHSRAGVAVLGSVMQAVTAKGHRPVLAVPPPVV